MSRQIARKEKCQGRTFYAPLRTPTAENSSSIPEDRFRQGDLSGETQPLERISKRHGVTRDVSSFVG